MKRIALTVLTGLSLSLAMGLVPARASMLDSATTAAARNADLYDVFHDRETNFVFVKLPSGWAFAGRDALKSNHEVFHDAVTGFVFVKLSGGWMFMGSVRTA